MILPDMRYADGIRKQKQLQFGGLNHNVGAEDGELWDMMNLCSDDYPVLSVRKKRQLYRKLEKPNGLFAWKGLMWVDGTDVYHNGVLVGEVEDSKKAFGAVGPYIVILPDKVCYHVETGDFEHLESKWEKGDAELAFTSGYLDGLSAAANCIFYQDDAHNWYDYFNVGDAVTISGCTTETKNNVTAVIREIDGNKLYFSENLFHIGFNDVIVGSWAGHAEEGAVTITREVPELLQLCEDGNRLWGCSKGTVYASKLGDPFNWNVFDGLETDSWTVTPGSSGEFTGCCNFQGYPTFFKEDRIYKAYGSVPSEFSLVDSPYLGVMAGCGQSLATVSGVLFYLSSAGPMAYTGSVPQPIGDAFGSTRFVGGVAGSDGIKYYVSLEDADGRYRLFVYDAQKGMWHIEDDMQATHLCRHDGELYCLDAAGQIRLLGDVQQAPEGCTEETDLAWFAEFGDFTHEDPNHKGLGKLQLRLQMEEGSEVKILVQYDSDGVWRLVRAVTGEGSKRNYYLPIIPRRCDHYRLLLEGTGRSRLYSLVRETYSGSERNAKYWR